VSVYIFQVGGKSVRGRQYPWGLVDIEDRQHSDFTDLRRFLIQTHMQDLKDVTHDVHYQNYRSACRRDDNMHDFH
jgi:septin family protein